ncbi:chaperone modulator CbpM [Methylicorpusculum oleiharenae]|uniref:chaperone modulator CbpM n=1 Tax=Methylicorpusculum oleiharenae TaxID=1338687 RepID=UPI001359006C|nr:chaperone modulator CbpM [Methylicorpusculum oleiharenae]MCD2449446.1 chaperone modulator CbpM [Methylicorpusculum oleiharenae]
MKSSDLLLVYTGTVIEEDSLTLGQLCKACGTNADMIISLVEESIIEPSGENIHEWLFSGANLVRARFALRLQRDLGINLAGIALVLDLMEEREMLRAQIAASEHRHYLR